MARPGQDPVSKDEIPWWLKFAGRGVGTVGGFSKFMLKHIGECLSTFGLFVDNLDRKLDLVIIFQLLIIHNL